MKSFKSCCFYLSNYWQAWILFGGHSFYFPCNRIYCQFTTINTSVSKGISSALNIPSINTESESYIYIFRWSTRCIFDLSYLCLKSFKSCCFYLSTYWQTWILFVGRSFYVPCNRIYCQFKTLIAPASKEISSALNIPFINKQWKWKLNIFLLSTQIYFWVTSIYKYKCNDAMPINRDWNHIRTGRKWGFCKHLSPEHFELFVGYKTPFHQNNLLPFMTQVWNAMSLKFLANYTNVSLIGDLG